MAKKKDESTTAGQSPAQAAETSRAAAPAPADAKTGTTDVTEAVKAGYLGVSPAREATGQDDKGLSQQNPEVMRRATAEDVGMAAITREALDNAQPVGGTADENK